MERIKCVDSVSVYILKSNPPQVGITALGKVPTSGWSKPALHPWFYIVPPADGIQDFDFVAEPPTGIALEVISPIVASAVIARDPSKYWGEGKPLTGVRIHSRENAVVALLDPKASPEDAARGGEVPWPWHARGVHISGDGDPFPLGPGAAQTFGGSDTPFPLSLSFPDLLFAGKILRVYHTGDAITRDHRPDRANIELSPLTDRIVRVWFG